MQDQYVTFSAAWFTLALINAGLAQAKQRSGLVWWFLSLLLGPLATFLIVASAPGGQPSETQQRVIVVGGVIVILLVLGLLAYRFLIS